MAAVAAAAIGGQPVQHPHSPSIGNGAGVGCSELPPTYCSPSRKWLGARDSSPEGGSHASGAPRPGHGVAEPGGPGNAESATGGCNREGPSSALKVHHMAWPADMQCRRGCLVSLKSGPQIHIQIPPYPPPPCTSPGTPSIGPPQSKGAGRGPASRWEPPPPCTPWQSSAKPLGWLGSA